jgi:hypothetical protein
MNALSNPDRQPCGVQHFAVGEAVVSVINDGIHPIAVGDRLGPCRSIRIGLSFRPEIWRPSL